MSDTSATSSVTKRGPSADRLEKNDFKRLKSELDPIVSQHTVTDNGSSIKCISLAGHHLAPSKFEELKFLKKDKQAKQLLKKHAARKTNTEIAKGRNENGKEAPSNIVAALGSDGEVYSLPSDCGIGLRPLLQPTVTTTNSERRRMTGGFVSSNELPALSTRTHGKSPFARCLWSMKERRILRLKCQTAASTPSTTAGSSIK